MKEDFTKREEALKELEARGGLDVIPLQCRDYQKLLAEFYKHPIELVQLPDDFNFYQLPQHTSRFRRGHFYKEYYANSSKMYYKWCVDRWRTIHSAIFTSAPRNASVYGDIPRSTDLYEFIKSPIFTYVHIGQNVFVVKKTFNSLRQSKELWEKEAENKYERIRIKKRNPLLSNTDVEERFSRRILKKMGFQWPTRKSAQRRDWPELFEKLGFSVKTSPGPLEHAPDVVLKILRGDLFQEEAALYYRVSEYQIKRWLKIYCDAGEAALRAKLNL